MEKVIDEILRRPGNRVCADCPARSPRWASVNLGVLVCIRCSGIHRNLGSHITKIKSVTLDKWTDEMLCVYKVLDNEAANQYWEVKLAQEAYRKPTAGSSNH
mmetsp:Transcript_3373/g.1988  ORF Transcript_3373/g.1988 Transcript_3373/m.1988 type:complete len:102 (+) Transcript_3373:134-439(+)